MSVTAFQTNGDFTFFSTGCSGERLRKHQSFALMAPCEENPPVTGRFPSQRVSVAESVSMSWRLQYPLVLNLQVSSSLCILYHYSDVIIGAMAYQITRLTLFTQPFIQAQIKENIKAPHHWPLCGEFTGHRWIPAQMASNAENVSIWWRHDYHVYSNVDAD